MCFFRYFVVIVLNMKLNFNTKSIKQRGSVASVIKNCL